MGESLGERRRAFPPDSISETSYRSMTPSSYLLLLTKVVSVKNRLLFVQLRPANDAAKVFLDVGMLEKNVDKKDEQKEEEGGCHKSSSSHDGASRSATTSLGTALS